MNAINSRHNDYRDFRWALYLACYATGGWEPGLAGVQASRKRALDVDLLMIVAAIGAVAIGQVFDGGLLIVIFATVWCAGSVFDSSHSRLGAAACSTWHPSAPP